MRSLRQVRAQRSAVGCGRNDNTGAQFTGRKGRSVRQLRHLAHDIAADETTGTGKVGAGRGRSARARRAAMANGRRVEYPELQANQLGCVHSRNHRLDRKETGDQRRKDRLARPCTKRAHGSRIPLARAHCQQGPSAFPSTADKTATHGTCSGFHPELAPVGGRADLHLLAKVVAQGGRRAEAGGGGDVLDGGCRRFE